MFARQKTLLLTLLLLLSTTTTLAGQLGIVVSGKSYHFDRDLGRNEKNYGLGAEYELEKNKKWIRFVVANGFVDSMDHMSYMAGFGVKRRLPIGQSSPWYFDVGIVGFVMTRREYHGHRPFPGVLPTLTIGRKRVALNLIYVPGFEPITEESLFLQLKINVSG